jgi:hypothetical protein
VSDKKKITNTVTWPTVKWQGSEFADVNVQAEFEKERDKAKDRYLKEVPPASRNVVTGFVVGAAFGKSFSDKRHEAEIASLTKGLENDSGGVRELFDTKIQLEADLAEKTAEFQRMETAWREENHRIRTSMYGEIQAKEEEIAGLKDEINQRDHLWNELSVLSDLKIEAQESIIKDLEEALKHYSDESYDYTNVAMDALTALKEFRKKL